MTLKLFPKSNNEFSNTCENVYNCFTNQTVVTLISCTSEVTIIGALYCT